MYAWHTSQLQWKRFDAGLPTSLPLLQERTQTHTTRFDSSHWTSLSHLYLLIVMYLRGMRCQNRLSERFFNRRTLVQKTHPPSWQIRREWGCVRKTEAYCLHAVSRSSLSVSASPVSPACHYGALGFAHHIHQIELAGTKTCHVNYSTHKAHWDEANHCTAQERKMERKKERSAKKSRKI